MDNRKYLIQVMVAIARADEELASVEREHIHQLMGFLRLDEEAQREAMAWMSAESAPPLPGPESLPSYDVRRYVFQHALITAFADGVIHEAERTHLDKLATVLELKEEDVVKGWQRARPSSAS